MSQPQDDPAPVPSVAGAEGAGECGQATSGPTSPGPYAGSPGTAMPASGVDDADAPRDHPGAIIAFILGIFSVVGFAVVGPVAWIMANKALKEMGPSVGTTYRNRSGGVTYRNRNLAVAAKVLGIIGTIFLILVIIAVVVFAIVAVAAARNSGA